MTLIGHRMETKSYTRFRKLIAGVVSAVVAVEENPLDSHLRNPLDNLRENLLESLLDSRLHSPLDSLLGNHPENHLTTTNAIVIGTIDQDLAQSHGEYSYSFDWRWRLR
jgi:hypothetical protein